MRGPFDVGIVADGLLGTGDDLIVGHEILIIIRDVVCLGTRRLFRTVGILHLMEVQGVGFFWKSLPSPESAGSVGLTTLSVSLPPEAALNPFSKFSPDSVARASPEDW